MNERIELKTSGVIGIVGSALVCQTNDWWFDSHSFLTKINGYIKLFLIYLTP